MGKESTTVASKNGVRDVWKEAEAAINFWQALEYLAPQSPPAVKLEDSVWEFPADAPEAEMPWSDAKKRTILDRQIGPNRKFQLFAGILGGNYFIESARRYLGADPIDQSELRPASPAACVVLNVNGRGMASGQVFVSTVPWAMAQISSTSDHATALNFRGFFGIEGLEEDVRKKVEDLMVARRLLARVPGEDPSVESTPPVVATTATPPTAVAGDETPAAVLPESRPEPPPLRPVTSEDVRAITDLVFELSGWYPEQQEMWRIQAQWAPEKDTGDNAASQDDPLNSFYAEDLEAVGDAVASQKIGAGLRAYLKGEDSIGRVDLESQVDQLIEGVHPSRLPAGCWPAKFPLVTAQQFAVNTVMSDLSASSGLFSVNGPPGTGKTTMLKDIIAAVVVDRADVLMEFDTPASAFPKRLGIEQYQYPVYELDARLRGFGIVVSSANNGAVENITKELPGLAAIAPGIDIDYFSMVADSAAAPPKAKQRAPKRERWGLVTAVLGNKTNRSQFATRFWLSGLPQKKNEGKPPEPDPLRLRSLQDLVKTGEHGALPWDEACRQYREARKKVDALTRVASEVADAIQQSARATTARNVALTALTENQHAVSRHKERLHKAQAFLDTALAASERATRHVLACTKWSDAEAQARTEQRAYDLLREDVVPGAVADAGDAHERSLAAIRGVQSDIEFHYRGKPGFFSELFRTQYSRRWNARGVELDEQLRMARAKEAIASDRIANKEGRARKLDTQAEVLTAAQEQAATCRTEAQRAGVPIDDQPSRADIDGLLERLIQARNHAASVVLQSRDTVSEAQALVDATQRRITEAQAHVLRAEADLNQAQCVLSASQVPAEKIRQWDLSKLERETLHRAAPYDFPELFEARRDVFIAAMNLHQAFVVAAWKPLSGALSAFVNLLQGNLNVTQITKGPIHLWDAFFLVVPVVSTTFASFPRLFRGVGSEQLAWLMIDEAGQATPQQAAGAIWRSKRSVIVGDPLQLEPVVGVPQEMMAPLLRRCSAEPHWAPPLASAQTLADRANRFGMYIGEPDTDERKWLGSPLLVHRRCLDPMFRIANSIAYNDKMVYGTGEDTGPDGIGSSCWVQVPAEHSDGHWVEAQALRAMELVERLSGGVLKENGQFKVYVITPFRAVAAKIRQRLHRRYGEESKGMAGTVHTFQGKEAEHVVFLLGGNPSSPGVISSFAGAKPNLVNVAVTRAKRRLYVVGDRRFWTGSSDVHRIFNRMAEHLDDVVDEVETVV
ncbi:DEAD/DEAH box helicase [Caballeronia sordidicola]|uniref:DEAD/DEAH box helicase n=1 Tax=Caballeronia sordidicola TaxID=196367 RepID=UPI0004D007F9|nr:AAA domain-containing protein [Caballeronia sordidicola]